MTAGRFKRVRKYLGDSTFCFTFGDGVADVDITTLISHHKLQGRLATVPVVQPPSRYGDLQFGEQNDVTGF